MQKFKFAFNHVFLILFSLSLLISRAFAQDLKISSGLQKISGSSLWFEYRIHGDKEKYPLLVFESGAISYSSYWNPVIDSISSFANTLRYDRAGLGNSSMPKEMTRSATQIAIELNELLDSLRINNKIILVCHSAGGFYGRAFSKRYPGKVSALILIESPCTQWEDYLRSCLTKEQNLQRDSILRVNRSQLSLVERKEYQAANINRKIFDEAPQMDIPVYIIHGIGHNWPQAYNGSLLSQKWKECQSSLQGISKNSSLIEVPKAGHHVFQEFDLSKFIYEEIASR